MKVRVVTEAPGWILHRMAEELRRAISQVRINEDWPEADIHYYVNYGFYRGRPSGGLVVGNFTHYDPDGLGDLFFSTAREMDHCIAISESTAEDLRRGGIRGAKIDVIVIGADAGFVPKLRVGVVGRTYPGGRKGEHIVEALRSDDDLMRVVELVATSEDWDLPVENHASRSSFYRSLDYLLVPSLVEGGPVPFMEALACGTMSIAPPIGVVPQFPHIEYPTGQIKPLKHLLRRLAEDHLHKVESKVSTIRQYNWERWAQAHREVFERLLRANERSVRASV